LLFSSAINIINTLTPPNRTPLNYVVPPFPSLYWPVGTDVKPYYLYHATDVWRFTVIWTLLFFGALHIPTSAYAVAMLMRTMGGNGKDRVKMRGYIMLACTMLPVVYAVVSAAQAFLAGSVVGGLLGAVYNAGYFKMSTWIPFVWGLVSAATLVLSGFAIQGSM
jgi:hypothetical protein